MSCVWTKLSTELKISCTSPGYTYIYIKDNTTRMICYISQPFEEDSLIYKKIYILLFTYIYKLFKKDTTSDNHLTRNVQYSHVKIKHFKYFRQLILEHMLYKNLPFTTTVSDMLIILFKSYVKWRLRILSGIL